MICFPKKTVYLAFFIIIILTSLFTAYKISQSENTTQTEAASRKVIGGTVADPGEWPFMVALYSQERFNKFKNVKDAFFCGGSLIDPQWILTAAHCVNPPFVKKPEDIKVVVNFNDFSDKKILEKSYDVEKVVIHENFINDGMFTVMNDIALIKLKTKQKSPYISLNSNVSLIKKGVNGYDLGWGITSQSSKKASDQLKEIDLSILIYKDQSKLYTNIFFAYNQNGGSAALGDSGGPLIIWNNNRYYVAGINSKEAFYRDWDVPNSPKFSGADLTNVAKYIDWIKDKTGIDFTKTTGTSFKGSVPEWISPTPKK